MTDEEATATAARVKWRDSQSSEFLRLHSELLTAKESLNDLRRENGQLMHRNRAAMRELKELRETKAPTTQLSQDAAREAEAMLTKELHRNAIIRNIFQVRDTMHGL